MRASVSIVLYLNEKPIRLSVTEARVLYFQLEDLLYNRNMAAEHIKFVVAHYFNIKIGALDGRRASPSVVRARWLAMALCKDTMSIHEIAAGFNRLPCTVKYALTELLDRIKLDKSIGEDLIALRLKLKEPLPSPNHH